MSIVCTSLTKYYGPKAALRDVSVTIPQGGITGLIGPNGAGKSTLIKLITGLIYPTKGHVKIDGFDSSSQHLEAMAQLGAIVEWPSFYPDLSARQNLAILSGGHGKHYEARLAEVTSFLGISDILDRKPNSFSTGMKQRLGIALAMLPDSRYIILDEPANGLDPEGIAEIRDLIRECGTRKGMTVLVSSHLLSEMELICGNVIMLAGGELRAAGPLKELLTQGNKYRIAGADPESTGRFLFKSWEEKVFWLGAKPIRTEDGFIISLPEKVSPAEASCALFNGRVKLVHFAAERATLEEFFISKSRSTTGV